MTRPAERLDDLDGSRWLSESEARTLLLAEVEQLRACEIRVFWPRDEEWPEGVRGRLWQFLDDGAYVVELDRSSTYLQQVEVLEHVWSMLLAPLDSAVWDVESAKPGEFDSVPTRHTNFVVRDRRG